MHIQKDGDKPVFAPNGRLIGFMSNGKFVKVENYGRYASSHDYNDKDSDKLEK